MADDQKQSADSAQGSGEAGATAVVAVPEHLAQQVIDFVSTLDEGEDVAGHAFRGGAMGGMRGGLAAKGWTGTQCSTQTTGFGTDSNMTCADTDEIVSKLT